MDVNVNLGENKILKPRFQALSVKTTIDFIHRIHTKNRTQRFCSLQRRSGCLFEGEGAFTQCFHSPKHFSFGCSTVSTLQSAFRLRLATIKHRRIIENVKDFNVIKSKRKSIYVTSSLIYSKSPYTPTRPLKKLSSK